VTRASAYNSLGSEFNEFLYAPIAEEHNGMVLSVLSALARLGLDPWEQAAQWDRLPGETAARDLAALIAALPDGPSARPDPEPLAARLIALLPHGHERTRVAPAAGASETNPASAPARSALYMVVYLILAVFLLCSQWFFGGRPAMQQPAAPHAAAAEPAAAPPAVPPAGSAP